MRYLICGAALLTAAAAHAQESSLLLPDSLSQTLQTVEVRSLRAAPKSPYAKTELTQKEIENNNLGQELPYLLQLTPAAVVSSDAGAGVGHTNLRIRGTDMTRINFTLNGIAINDAESQGAFFLNTPDLASSTQSIQVQRGIGSATNGAGAFGATVSIANAGVSDKATVSAHVGFGSFNTQKYTLQAGTGWLNNKFALDVRLSKIHSDGYIQRSESELQSMQVAGAWRQSDKATLRLMILMGQQRSGQAWDGVPEDSLAANRTYNGLGLKRDGTYYDNQTDNYRQNYYQLFQDYRFSHHLSGSLGLFLTRGMGYYEEYRTREKFSSYYLPDFIAGGDTFKRADLIRQLWLDNYNYGGVFSFIYKKEKLEATFGGGLSQYEGLHYGKVKWAEFGFPADYEWYRNDAFKRDANAYLKGQYTLGKWLLFGEAQVRAVHYRMHGFRKYPNLFPEANYTFFNPRLGLTYLIQQFGGQEQKAYASVAYAGHEPNRKDFEASPGQQPKAELMTDVEAGYKLRHRKYSVGVNGYYMHYKDQLVLTGQINDVGAYTRTNVPLSYRAGVELIAAAKPFDWLALNANATFSQNKIKDFTEYLDDYDAGDQAAVYHGTTDIAFSPAVLVRGGAVFTPFYGHERLKQLQVGVWGQHVGRQYLDNTSNESRSLKAYTLCDVKLHYDVRLRSVPELSVNLALNNIFNRMYESNGYTYSYLEGGSLYTSNAYFPQAGFNWLLGVGVKL